MATGSGGASLRTDEEAIAAFCREVSPRLIRSLTLYCGSAEVAEEIAQDALARAWERWDSVGKLDSPEAWVFKVGVNQASSWWRRRSAERRALARSAHETQQAVPDAADAHEIWEAVAQLAPRQRAAAVPRHVGQLSVAETAEALRCAEGTVKALTSQGLARLRELLGEEE